MKITVNYNAIKCTIIAKDCMTVKSKRSCFYNRPGDLLPSFGESLVFVQMHVFRHITTQCMFWKPCQA